MFFAKIFYNECNIIVNIEFDNNTEIYNHLG